MEGSTPTTGIDNAPALKKQRDDFGTLPEDEKAAEAALKVELAKKPVYKNVCSICNTVHAVDGDPICKCVKCGHVCRIVWCGQCVCCAYSKFAEKFGDGVANILYPKYGAYVQKLREEQAKANLMPWEK